MIDPRTLAPLDTQTILESVEKTGRLVLVDQATRHASAATVIAGEVAEHGFSSLEGADRAGHRARRDGALQPAARGVRHAGRGQGRRRGAAGARVGARDGVVTVTRARPRAGAGPARDDVADPRCSRSGSARLKPADEVYGLIHLSVGPGGRRRGGVLAAARRRRRLLGSPRARARDREGRIARAHDGRADGPRHRALPGARRVDAPGRRRARLHGRDGRRRRQHPDRARQRARRAAAAARTRSRSSSSATAPCRPATSTRP